MTLLEQSEVDELLRAARDAGRALDDGGLFALAAPGDNGLGSRMLSAGARLRKAIRKVGALETTP